MDYRLSGKGGFVFLLHHGGRIESGVGCASREAIKIKCANRGAGRNEKRNNTTQKKAQIRVPPASAIVTAICFLA